MLDLHSNPVSNLVSCIFYKPFYCLKNKPQTASVMESNLFTQQILSTYYMHIASLVAQRLKCLPPMRETRVRSLGRENPLEKEMVTHSSILAWRLPWTEKPGGLLSMRSQRVGHDLVTKQLQPPPPGQYLDI